MSENKSGMNRRSFLQIASIAGVAAGCSPVKTASKLSPYLDPPIDQVPGTPVFYRTACRECPAGCGVTARTREGRVIKLEGNPDDPISGGSLCARGQAAVQMLYAPDRLKGPMRRNKSGGFDPLSWDDALAAVGAALDAAHAKRGGAGIRFVTRSEPGAIGALQREFMSALGADAASRLVLEPFDPHALRVSGERFFGRRDLPAFDTGAARSVVSFGADFLESWVSPVEMTRGFAAGRGNPGELRTRLTWVGPRLSATAASAEVWLRARPGSEGIVALGLVRWLSDPANAVADLVDAAAIAKITAAFTPAEVEARSGITAAQLAALGHELASRRPSLLLGPGPGAGAEAGAIADAVVLGNHLLGNGGKTVRWGVEGDDAPGDPAAVASLRDVDVLFVHRADPVGTVSGARAAVAAIPMIVSFSDRLDETTKLANIILPDHHALESWAELASRRDRVAFGQPAMTPLNDTRAASQSLIDLAGKTSFAAGKIAASDAGDFIRAKIDAHSAGADAHAALARGVVTRAFTPEAVTLRVAPPVSLPAAAGAPALALVGFPTALRYDGRTAAPWLSEVADATSTVAWTPWVEASPATAAKLGLTTGRRVALKTASGAAELTVYVYPGIADGVLAIPLGSAESLALLPATAVELTALGHAMLPQLEGLPEPHAGALLADITGDEKPKLPRIEKLPMIDAPTHPKHRWAMSIDLDKCVGCNACTVACYAENNLPVFGPERIDEGRSMAWIKLDRFFEEGDPAKVDFVPMLCQQCTNAPCEVVCPVDATYHTSEGLNAQIYNRCVGTRYCANNCPYKVRVFNWEDPVFTAPLHMQLNPEVSVRSKGVMEKCTFCVQRIRYGENLARNEDRAVTDADVQPACAQTCPAKAIVFGDAHDPASKVSLLAKDPRAFHALGELNTLPAVTYLASGRLKGSK